MATRNERLAPLQAHFSRSNANRANAAPVHEHFNCANAWHPYRRTSIARMPGTLTGAPQSLECQLGERLAPVHEHFNCGHPYTSISIAGTRTRAFQLRECPIARMPGTRTRGHPFRAQVQGRVIWSCCECSASESVGAEVGMPSDEMLSRKRVMWGAWGQLVVPEQRRAR